MFILRKIDKEGVETNYFLGKSYRFVQEQYQPEDFAHIAEKWKQTPIHDRLYGFVVPLNGEEIYLLHGEKNYIMTDSGATFTNITCQYLPKGQKAEQSQKSFSLKASGREEMEIIQCFVNMRKEKVEDDLGDKSTTMQPDARAAWQRELNILTRWNDELLTALKRK